MIKILLKTVAWIITGFLTFVASYITIAYTLSHITISKEAGALPDVAIYILTNGDHTDIIVPVKNEVTDWSQKVKYDNTLGKDTTARQLALGWGDKGFYLNTPTWAQLKFSVAFRAATGLSTSAMHATFYHDLKEGADCKKIMISKRQYARLVEYVTNSFKSDSAGQFENIITTAQYGKDDAFYEAKRRYNMFYTCNTWANNALKSCGQKACLWTPFDKGIFDQYK